MMTMEDLMAALNDPASPMRERLLNNLSMSPLDPAAAYQQLQQSSAEMARGGLPPPPQQPQQDFASMINPISSGADLSRGANPQGVVNLANSSQIMPGETGGIPDAAGGGNVDAMKRMFEGVAGAAGQDWRDQMPWPSAPAPQGNRWGGFQAGQLATPAVAPQRSLSEILAGRR